MHSASLKPISRLFRWSVETTTGNQRTSGRWATHIGASVLPPPPHPPLSETPSPTGLRQPGGSVAGVAEVLPSPCDKGVVLLTLTAPSLPCSGSTPPRPTPRRYSARSHALLRPPSRERACAREAPTGVCLPAGLTFGDVTVPGGGADPLLSRYSGHQRQGRVLRRPREASRCATLLKFTSVSQAAYPVYSRL